MTYPKFSDFLLLIFLSMIFGFSFVLIKISVQAIPPLIVVCLRVIIAAIFLNIFLGIKNKKLVLCNFKWKNYFIQGLIGYTLPFFLVTYGAQKLNSSYVAMMMASLPLITAVIVYFCSVDEKIDFNKIAGVTIGFIGVLFLFLQKPLQGDYTIVSCMAVFFGCISFGFSTVFGKKFKNDPPLITTANILTITSVYLFPIILLYFLQKPSVGINAILSVTLLGILCTGIAYYIFFQLLSRIGAMWTSTHDYLVPIFGALPGVIFFGETISFYEILGVFFTFAGIYLMYDRSHKVKIV